jgi:hypothetical protein
MRAVATLAAVAVALAAVCRRPTAADPADGGRPAWQVVVATARFEPSFDTVAEDLRRANEIYAAIGLTIKTAGAVVYDEDETVRTLGEDLALDLQTADEQRLVTHQRLPRRLTAYWVPQMKSGRGDRESRGQTLDERSRDGLPADRTSVVINTAERGRDTFAHELGHALGLPHDSDPENLMARGKHRRLDGQGIDRLTSAQLETIRKSPYLEPAVATK